MDVLTTHVDDEPHLEAEVSRAWPEVRLEAIQPGVLRVDGRSAADAPGCLVFLRQALFGATWTTATSIRAWAECLVERLPELAGSDGFPRWRLQVWPRYGGDAKAGWNRTAMIVDAVEAMLSRRRREILRRLERDPKPFSPGDGLVQLMLTTPETGWVSVWLPPSPNRYRQVVSPFLAGEIPVAVDKTAPSRAFAKLVEAEARLAVSIGPGETCVDLGASPGSWSHVALGRGATVTAVDRAGLRADLMRHPRLRFRSGDAFGYRPEGRVDWLLCDVIAAPERSIDLLLRWLDMGWCRRFVVTIKFKGTSDYTLLEPLKGEIRSRCLEFRLTRLCANRNEACVAGVAAGGSPGAG